MKRTVVPTLYLSATGAKKLGVDCVFDQITCEHGWSIVFSLNENTYPHLVVEFLASLNY